MNKGCIKLVSKFLSKIVSMLFEYLRKDCSIYDFIPSSKKELMSAMN